MGEGGRSIQARQRVNKDVPRHATEIVQWLAAGEVKKNQHKGVHTLLPPCRRNARRPHVTPTHAMRAFTPMPMPGRQRRRHVQNNDIDGVTQRHARLFHQRRPHQPTEDAHNTPESAMPPFHNAASLPSFPHVHMTNAAGVLPPSGMLFTAARHKEFEAICLLAGGHTKECSRASMVALKERRRHKAARRNARAPSALERGSAQQRARCRRHARSKMHAQHVQPSRAAGRCPRNPGDCCTTPRMSTTLSCRTPQRATTRHHYPPPYLRVCVEKRCRCRWEPAPV